MLTTVLIFYVGAPIFRGAWIGLRTGMLNMDNLLALAILAAYGYSISQLVAGSLDLYFDVAAVIVAVVTVGRYLERGAKARATSELVNVMEVWTPSAHVRKDGELYDQSVDQLEPGDRIVILQGERIPVDGTVVEGQGAVDESLMTGEPVPVTRGRGEEVLGGAVVVEGTLEIEVGPSGDSRTDNLARILWNVQSSTAGVQRISDRIARVFVPVVIALAVLVSGWLLFNGTQPGPALLAGLATLIVSCPCTFGLAIPLATAVGVSTALRRGIIVTSADTFEKAPQIDIIAIDKTGILSTGEMAVVEVIGPAAVAEYAAAVERLSSHPIAEAIARLDARRTASDLAIQPGKGAVASVDGRRVAVGSKSLFATLGWDIPDRLASLTTSITTAESVVSYVGWDGRTLGAIISRDQSRPEWKAVVNQLRKHSRVILLTGAEHPGEYEDRADEVHAGVPPEAKAAVIRRLRSEGTVVMIGDGSNDAPALAAADLGIAFGAPTALAADAADVVILGNRLDRLFDAFELIWSYPAEASAKPCMGVVVQRNGDPPGGDGAPQSPVRRTCDVRQQPARGVEFLPADRRSRNGEPATGNDSNKVPNLVEVAVVEVMLRAGGCRFMFRDAVITGAMMVSVFVEGRHAGIGPEQHDDRARNSADDGVLHNFPQLSRNGAHGQQHGQGTEARTRA